ncbi:MAG TPA: TolC family protein [Kofleriaceae bacterium]|nr:TolC family protein [Kofleriaceae bacterium]
MNRPVHPAIRATLLSTILLASAGAAADPAPPVPPLPPATPSNLVPPPPDAVIRSTANALRKVSFAQAIQLALEQASDARIAADEVARAAALLAEAAAALRPVLGVAGTYQQLEADRTVSGRQTTAAESFLGQVTVAMPIMNFRERADRQRAADQLEVERTTAATIRRTVAIQAGRAYLAVFAAKRIIEVAEQARETAAAHVTFATQRTAGGIGTELDIVRAQAELATDESNLASAETALVQAEEALGVITGQSAPLGSTDEPNLDAGPDTAGVVKRADVVAGERRLASAEWSRGAQWAEWVPTLSINGNAFYTTPQIDPTPRLGFQVLAVLAMPLYDGGFRDGLRQERDAVLAEAREELAQLERSASSEVRASQDAVRRAREARDASHRSADLAARALELANVAYSGGTGTSLEVIDAQRSARDAATQAVIADDGLRQAEFGLLAATGHVP